MPAFQKFNSFVEARGRKVHNLHTDVLKVMWTNTAPLATNTVKADTGYFHSQVQEVLFRVSKRFISDADLAHLSALVRQANNRRQALEFAVFLTHIRL